MIEDNVASYLVRFFRVMENVSLKNFSRQYIKESGRKRKRIQALLYGVVTHFLTLNRVARDILGDKFDRLSDRKKMLVIVYLYRILYQSIIPEGLKKDIILKSLLKARFPDPMDDIDRVVINTSFPRWVVEKLIRFMSLSEIEDYLGSLNRRQPTYILVNQLKYDAETAQDYLTVEGVDTKVDKDFSEMLILIKTMRGLHRTHLYKEGAILPMSKSSLGVVKALDPTEGDVIVDACAAPGIKTIAMYMLCRGECMIYAYDVDRKRLERMNQLLKKYGISNIEISLKDARSLKIPEDANKVLIDAPCTSTGMIPDSPDIKLRISEEKLFEFTSLQREILKNFVKQMRDGLEIVYSTCSIFPEEGEMQISYLKKSYGVKINEISFADDSYIGRRVGVRFYPHRHKTIGMFISKFST